MSGEVPASGNASQGDGEFSYRLDRSKAGTPAPTFAFQNPDGGEATLQDFAGRPMLVGSIPGIIVGSLLSSKLPDRLVRSVLALVLMLVGIKLLVG